MQILTGDQVFISTNLKSLTGVNIIRFRKIGRSEACPPTKPLSNKKRDINYEPVSSIWDMDS